MIDLGKLAIHPAAEAIGPLLVEAVEGCAREALDKQIHFEAAAVDPALGVCCDRQRVIRRS